jgi:hypothetical protein
VLEHPEWPLTNNEAERALRHWVIARRIMMGTRCDAGLRTFTLLASVIETCRQRGHLPWTFWTASSPTAVPVARQLLCRLRYRVSERLRHQYWNLIRKTWSIPIFRGLSPFFR